MGAIGFAWESKTIGRNLWLLWICRRWLSKEVGCGCCFAKRRYIFPYNKWSSSYYWFWSEGYIIGTRRYEDTGIDSLIYNHKEKTITQYTGDKKQYIDCYKYDERGNVIEKRWGRVSLPSYKYYHITYNNRGQKIKEISSISKKEIKLGEETIYKYDSKGRIIYEEEKGILGEIREYTYNKKGDIQTIRKKPFLEPEQELWYEYTYDKQGNYIKSILYLKDKIEGKLTSRVTERKIEYY